MFEQVPSDYIYLRLTGNIVSSLEEPDVDKIEAYQSVISRLTPSEPTEELGVDKIETYQSVISALQEARDTLSVMNDSQGRTIDRKRAIRCRVAADRCASALENLQKAAEL